jgi:DNA-binding CsgD family transcriptional regulator
MVGFERLHLGGPMNRDLVLRSQSPFLPEATFRLQSGTFVLGRSSTCDFVVKDASISRRHAQITLTGGKMGIRDLGSRNGTYLNAERVHECGVQRGDHVSFGKVTFLLTHMDENGVEPDSECETDRCDDLGKTIYLDPVKLLSKSQRRVFAHLADGLSDKEIAEQLHVSPFTVHNHVTAIFRILKVHSRPELFARYVAHRNDDADQRLKDD